MDDKIFVAVQEPLHNLLEEILGLPLIKLLPASHEVKQVSSSAQLHHKAKVRVCLKGVIQLHYISVAGQLLQDLQVLVKPLLTLCLTQVFFLEALHCHKMAR